MFVLHAALEKKMAGRQGREDLIKKGLLEMMEQGKWAREHRVGCLTGAQQIPQGGVSQESVVRRWQLHCIEASMVREVFQVGTHGSTPASEGPLHECESATRPGE